MPTKRDVRLWLTDILEAIGKIQRYTEGVSFEEFEANPLLVDAVVRNLEIVGEAARQIPAELRAKYHDVPWKRVIGLRNIVVHAYFEVDPEIVWTIVSTQLSGLESAVRRMLEVET